MQIFIATLFLIGYFTLEAIYIYVFDENYIKLKPLSKEERERRKSIRDEKFDMIGVAILAFHFFSLGENNLLDIKILIFEIGYFFFLINIINGLSYKKSDKLKRKIILRDTLIIDALFILVGFIVSKLSILFI